MMGIPDLSRFEGIGRAFIECWQEANHQARIANQIAFLRAVNGPALVDRESRETLVVKIFEELDL